MTMSTMGWKRIAATTVALLALTVAAAASSAGAKWSPVTLVAKNGATGWAWGTLGAARNGGGAGSPEFVACTVMASGTSQGAYCVAKDAAGTSGSCFAANASQVKVIQSMRGDSEVYFEWDTSGKCTYLGVATGSPYELKKP
jgi:hypothetical protein